MYLFVLIGHLYGPGFLIWYLPLNIEWFINIDWGMIKNAYIPKFPLEKIIVLIGIGLIVVLTSSSINYLENNKLERIMKWKKIFID